jgi:hypothetical protein
VAEQRGSAQYEWSYRKTLALAEQVPAELRSDPGVCGTWSLKDLMGHLAFWDDDLADELDAKRMGTRLPTSSERDWEAINADQAKLRAEWDWDAVINEVRANHERLVPLLNDPGENADDEPIHEHWDEHRSQIEGWLQANGHGDSEPRVERARETYLALQQSTVELAAGLPEALRNDPGVCGNWTLTELMAHLAFWDGVVADRLSARKAGIPWESDQRELDIINSEAAMVRADCTWDEILDELTTNRERLESLLADPGEGAGFKIYMHWQAHGAQIEAWAAEHSHV